MTDAPMVAGGILNDKSQGLSARDAPLKVERRSKYNQQNRYYQCECFFMRKILTMQKERKRGWGSEESGSKMD